MRVSDWTVLTFVLIPLLGCNGTEPDGTPWPLGGSVEGADVRPDERDTSPRLDGDVRLDTNRADIGVDTTDVRGDVPDRDACTPEISFRTSSLELAYVAERPLSVAGGDIYTEVNPGGMRRDPTEIARIDADTGDRSVLTSNDSHDQLLEAAERGAESVALIRRSDSRRGTKATPVIVSRDGGEEVVDPFPEDWKTRRARGGQGSRASSFDGERFAFMLPNDPMQAPGWVGYYDGSTAQKVHVQQWITPPVALLSNGFAVSGRTGPISGGGNYEIFTFREGQGLNRRTKTDGDERTVVADGTAVYWRNDRKVMRYDAAPDRKERLHRGACGAMAAAHGRAIFACDTEESRIGVGVGRTVHLYEGGKVRELPTKGGRIFEPSVGRRGAVWVEYDDPKALCRGQKKGRLIYADLQSDSLYQIAEVGAPCLCCGSRFPDLHVSYDDGVVAWNYASPDSSSPSPRGYEGGYAVVERRCR